MIYYVSQCVSLGHIRYGQSKHSVFNLEIFVKKHKYYFLISPGQNCFVGIHCQRDGFAL